MIKLNNIITKYDDWQVNYNLHIQEGELVAVVGESGAGKTTLLNIIAGFLPIYKGELILNNINYTNIAANKRPISFIFQNNNLFPNLTILENLIIINGKLTCKNNEYEYIYEKASEIGIEKFLHKKPEDLSGGQQQRVAILRTLLLNRPILLMDEPFATLDNNNVKLTYNLTKKIIKQKKLTAIIVTHHIEQLKDSINKVITISNGKIFNIQNY